MLHIPAISREITTTFLIREVGFRSSQHDLLNGFGCPPRLHQHHTLTHTVNEPAFLIDETLVTNAQFADFLAATAYTPNCPENFLQHWQGSTPPSHLLDHPVVYVSLDDARAYATWAGKQLPTENQWHLAAQGTTSFNFPWGDAFDPARCNTSSSTSPVRAFPQGRSPLGCFDMTGNVFQLTESLHDDGINRFLILRGSASYAAKDSPWYTTGGPQPLHVATKFLLIHPSLDRCATIGFRCVKPLSIHTS